MQNQGMTEPTRRDFLKRAASITGALAVWPAARAGTCTKPNSKNDQIQVAAIGTSLYKDRWGVTGIRDGRGAVVGHQAGELGNMVAVCDVNRKYAEAFASRYDGKCKVFGDYRKLLDRKDIDAVTIGTPDHWHTAIAIAAMKSGKDVYCEKPLTLTIGEGVLLCKVAKETGRVFQVGTQQRSESGLRFLKAVVLARSGKLGKKLRATSAVDPGQKGGPFNNENPPEHLDWDFWLGQAPKVPYCPQRCDYDFRWWLEYSGGQVTDWGVHHTDIALWALGLESTGPAEVEGTGDFPKVENGYNTAYTFDCTMKFAGGKVVRLNSDPNMLTLEGENGKILVNRSHLSSEPKELLLDQDPQWFEKEIGKLFRGKKPGSHMGNFFECMEDRSLPISDIFTHHRSVSACHLCNIAMLLGRKLRWDPEKEDFIDDPEASSKLRRKQRKPYTIEV